MYSLSLKYHQHYPSSSRFTCDFPNFNPINSSSIDCTYTNTSSYSYTRHLSHLAPTTNETPSDITSSPIPHTPHPTPSKKKTTTTTTTQPPQPHPSPLSRPSCPSSGSSPAPSRTRVRPRRRCRRFALRGIRCRIGCLFVFGGIMFSGCVLYMFGGEDEGGAGGGRGDGGWGGDREGSKEGGGGGGGGVDVGRRGGIGGGEKEETNLPIS